MKTILVILILFFIWQLWDLIVVGRQDGRERIRRDEKFKAKKDD